MGNNLGLKSSLSDTDVWFKEATDKAGNEYYTYILIPSKVHDHIEE